MIVWMATHVRRRTGVSLGGRSFNAPLIPDPNDSRMLQPRRPRPPGSRSARERNAGLIRVTQPVRDNQGGGDSRESARRDQGPGTNGRHQRRLRRFPRRGAANGQRQSEQQDDGERVQQALEHDRAQQRARTKAFATSEHDRARDFSQRVRAGSPRPSIP